jgi:hypothetical protein
MEVGEPDSIAEKNRGTFASVIVTDSRYELPGTCATVTPVVNPFFDAMSSASVVALAKSPGIQTTPAIAAASAARWMRDARAYSPPRSTANADDVSNTVIVNAHIHAT